MMALEPQELVHIPGNPLFVVFLLVNPVLLSSGR